MNLSEKAQTELDDIVHFIHWQTSHLTGEPLRIFMTPMLGHPHSIRLFHPQLAEDRKEAERLQKIFRKIDLTYLRKETVHPEKGAWFSVDFEVDCEANWDLDIEDRDITVRFNYDKLFNILAKNCSYNPKDLLLPTCEMFLKDLKRYPRTEENIPSWYPDLLTKMTEDTSFIKNVDEVKDAFAEAFEVLPEMTGGYAKVAHLPFWSALWRTVSTHFERSMVTNPAVIRAFMDPKYRFMRYDSLLWSAREFSDYLARNNLETNRSALSAKIFNGAATLGEYRGPKGTFDLKNLVPEDVERAFSDVVYQMLMLQNKQRFPEYFNNH